MSFTEVMDDIARGFESIGVFVLILGLMASLVFAALATVTGRAAGIPDAARDVRRRPAARSGDSRRR